MPSGFAIFEARARKRRADVAKAKIKARKLPPQIPPRGLERTYTRELLRAVKKITDLIEANVFPDLPAIASDAGFFRPDGKEIRIDDAADLIAAAIAKTQLQLSGETTALETAFLAERISNQISSHNQQQTNKVFRSALGIDVVTAEVGLRPEIKSFVGENVGLIKSIEADLLRDVEQTVFRGARQGLRSEEIAKNIQKRFKVSRNRAKLIGRDQVNKFNGKLSELRQKSAGVKDYIWRTVKDERVRPEHAAREGRKFSWDKPPPDGHPGEPIQCRCFAEPVLEPLLN